MIRLIEKYPVLSLIGFVIVTFGLTIDAIPVSIMEARNFVTAREMLTDDNWILTTLNGEPRYQKPPLPTWITAIFAYLFGIKSVLALRWPALLMLSSIGIGLHYFSKQLGFNKSQRLITGFIGITSFYTIGIIVEAPWDIYAHGFMLLGVLCLFQMLKAQNLKLPQALGFVICLAASILSKGPVSLYVLFLSFMIAYGIAYGYKGGLVFLLKLTGLLIAGLVIGGFWYYYVRVSDPVTFTQIASKETSNWSNYNVRPFYYYWSFFVQSGLWTIPAFISLLYPYMKSRVSNLQSYRFAFFWTVIAVILLSLIPEKKSRYLMPVLIPLAIIAGCYLEYLIREFKSLHSYKETVPVYFNFGLIGVIAIAIAVGGLFFSEFDFDLVLFRYILGSSVSVVLGILMFRYLLQKNIKTVVYTLLAFVSGIGLFLLPLAKLTFQEDFAPEALGSYEDKEIYALRIPSPECMYYLGKRIPIIDSGGQLKMPESSRFKLLTNNEDPRTIKAISEVYDIAYLRSVDLNPSANNRRGYRDRLVFQVYELNLK